MRNFERPPRAETSGQKRDSFGLWEAPNIQGFSEEESGQIYLGKTDAVFEHVKMKAEQITDPKERDQYTGLLSAHCNTAIHEIMNTIETLEDMRNDEEELAGKKKEKPSPAITRLTEELHNLEAFEKRISSLITGAE
jgi:hypothetical protein